MFSAVNLPQITFRFYFRVLKPEIKMKISLWSIGKTHDKYVKEGVAEFTKRISKYFPVEWTIIPVPKNAGMLSEMDLRKKEGETVLQWLRPGNYLVALDEH